MTGNFTTSDASQVPSAKRRHPGGPAPFHSIDHSSTPHINTVRLLRRRLSERDGRDVSKLDLANLLGVSVSWVSELEGRRRADVPPALRMACSFISRVGWETAEVFDDPETGDIEAICRFLFLPLKQVALLLGLSRQHFHKLRAGGAEVDVKPYYRFALLEVKFRFGMSQQRMQELHYLLDQGIEYRDRAPARA